MKMKKRSLGKHSENSKSKKINKIFLIIILIGVIIIAIEAIIIIKNRNVDDKSNIEKTINKTFSALKDSDVDKVNRHLNYKILVNSLDKIILEQNEGRVSNVEKKLFTSMEWTIEDIQMDDENTAEAIVEVTNKNYNNIIIKWIQSLLEMDEASITDKIQVEKLSETIDEITKTKTIIKKIKLVRNEENWIIEVNTDLRDLVFPGIDSIATILEGYK